MRVIIIGTGLAGQLVLRGLRQAGLSEKVLMFTEHSGDFYAKPSLSNVWSQDKTPDDLVVMAQDEVESDLNCEIHQKKVISIDKENKCIHTENETFEYDVLVLGIGARWVDLPILPEHPKVFRVNHLDDYRGFYSSIEKDASIAIIGGGLIGVEFAYDIAKHCHKVTVIERNQHLIGTMVPAEVGKYVKDGLVDRGVDVKVGTEVQAIEIGEPFSLSLSDGQLQADVIMAAVGLRSEVALAKEAGLEVSDAIEVNEYGQSSDPSIYALGDCAKVCGLVKRYVAPMRVCAKTIAEHIMGKQERIIYPPLPVLVKTPEMPVCFCYKDMPTEWEISEDSEGIEALAYEGDELTGYVLAGGKVARRIELKEKIKPWLT